MLRRGLLCCLFAHEIGGQGRRPWQHHAHLGGLQERMHASIVHAGSLKACACAVSCCSLLHTLNWP